MRRGVFAVAGLVGAALLAVLVPLYDAPEPRGLTVTRGRVREVADAEARKWGIEVDKAFVVTTVGDSPLLDKELRDKPDLRRRADRDPVLGPRLFGFDVTYWRNGVDKYPPLRRRPRLAHGRGPRRAAAGAERGGRGIAEGGRPSREGGRVRRLARVSGRPEPGLRGREADRPEVAHGPHVPLPGGVRRSDGRRRLLPLRQLHRRQAGGLRAHRGVPGRAAVSRTTRASAGRSCASAGSSRSSSSSSRSS